MLDSHQQLEPSCPTQPSKFGFHFLQEPVCHAIAQVGWYSHPHSTNEETETQGGDNSGGQCQA